MSGHSKWSTIKRKKGINDAKKGALFTQISKQITHAARSSGDPNLNFLLRIAIQKAKEANMSSENIERAIKKGTGEDKTSAMIESVEYAGLMGPVSILIDTLTDNRNRTIAEIRTILDKNGGTVVESGAVSWQYSSKGLMSLPFDPNYKDNKSWNDKDKTMPVKDLDEFIEVLLEVDGVEDVQQEGDKVYVYTDFDKLDNVRKSIEVKSYTISSFEIVKVANSPIDITEDEQENLGTIIDLLEENEDVSNVWVNI